MGNGLPGGYHHMNSLSYSGNDKFMMTTPSPKQAMFSHINPMRISHSVQRKPGTSNVVGSSEFGHFSNIG